MKAHEDFLPWALLEEQISALKLALDVNDIKVVRSMLENLVSGYKANGEIVDWIWMAQWAELIKATGE